MEKTIHEGRNVKRIREMLGNKQDALAIELGDDWNHKKKENSTVYSVTHINHK